MFASLGSYHGRRPRGPCSEECLMSIRRFSMGLNAIVAIFATTLIVTATAAQQETVLHTFRQNAKDGVWSFASLIFDASGNLYGTTSYGGAYNQGTVFELSPEPGGGWTEKVLHSFGNGKDGVLPFASLVFDVFGNLYGTTSSGGDGSCVGLTPGCGLVFELKPGAGGSWTEKILHNFNNNGTDGYNPNSGLIFEVIDRKSTRLNSSHQIISYAVFCL